MESTTIVVRNELKEETQSFLLWNDVCSFTKLMENVSISHSTFSYEDMAAVLTDLIREGSIRIQENGGYVCV